MPGCEYLRPALARFGASHPIPVRVVQPPRPADRAFQARSGPRSGTAGLDQAQTRRGRACGLPSTWAGWLPGPGR